MFKCDVCGCSGKGEGKIDKDGKEVTKMTSGTKMKRIISQYKNEKYGKPDGRSGLRLQIKKELKVCPICYEKMKNYEPIITD